MTGKEYLQLFIDETREYLLTLNELLVKVREGDENSLKEVLRLIHSIKGNAAMLELNAISTLAHKVEDVLIMIRDGRIRLNNALISKLFRIVDLLSEALDALEKNGRLNEEIEKKLRDVTSQFEKVLSNSNKRKLEEEISSRAEEALEFIKQHKGRLDDLPGLDKVTEELTSTISKITEARDTESIGDELLKLGDEERRKAALAIKRGLHLYKIILKFNVEQPLMTLRYFIALSKLGEVGDIIKSVPSGDEISKSKTKEVKILMAIKKLAELEDKVKEIPDLESYNTLRVNPEDIGITEDVLKNVKGEGTDDKVMAIERILREVEERRETEGSNSYSASHKMEEVRVNVKSLDKLFNLVGELVLIKSRLSAVAARHDIPILKEVLATFSRLVSELQDEVMRMRLVPLQYLFKMIPRYVSETASKYGKEVDILLEGEEITLDRKVLEELSRPIFTLIEVLIRDDIEKPEERVKKGKDKIATLHIKASREGNYVIISVGSDGRGIDVDEVKKRAIELGLMPASVIEKMSNEEALLLVTMPGFSLKNGEFSGLDAVKKCVESLGGSLEIYTVLDAETKFLLKIPVSMATLRALLIRLNDEVYAIPMSSVITTLKVNEEDLEYLGGYRVIKYQNQVIPFHNLKEVLGMPNEKCERNYAVIVEKRGKLLALGVDEILDQDDIVVKPLGKILSGIRGISGATVLGGGKVCLILDIQSLVVN